MSLKFIQSKQSRESSAVEGKKLLVERSLCH